MLNTFGKYLRKLRIDRGELTKEMADKLGVTASYISAVETGKRAIPSLWVGKIAELYDLNDDQKAELAAAASQEVNP